MTPPTPRQLAARLSFSAQLLADLADSIRANLELMPATTPTLAAAATLPQLREISAVYQRSALLLQPKTERSSRRQPPAANRTSTPAPQHA